MKRIAMLALAMMMLCVSAMGMADTLKVGMECNYAPYNWTQSAPSDEAVAIAAGGYADGYDVRIATNDGSVGKKGFVTELIPELLAAPAEKPFFVYGCGPKPMLMALAALMRKENMKGELSLDEIMCCGVGSCFGCVVKVNDESSPDKFRYARSCKEGPVFMAEDIYIGE